MRKSIVLTMIGILCISFLAFAGRFHATGSSSNALVNGDFETGTLGNWNVQGVCSVSSSTVHNGSYSAYISSDVYDSSISQEVNLPADDCCHFEGWIYPLRVGNLGNAYTATSYIKLRFYNASSMLFAFNVDYIWCWNSATVNDNGTDNVKFLLPFTPSAWNLLSRNVTQDVCSYFVGINISKYMLYSITAFYHYSNGDPGAFYLDDLNLSQLGPRTWIVDDDGPADFHTIQEAINAASDGDTIFVRNGTYYEHVTVNKALSIIASGPESTTINGSTSESAVEITADNVELSGFTICGGGFGLKVYSHNNNVHDNSIVENGFIGIYLYLSSVNTFTSNNITRNGYGVSLVHSGGNTFRRNLIFDNEWQELVVEGNTVSNFLEDMDTSNSVDGKPVYYWVDQQDKIVPSDAGYVALVDCRGILVQNLTFTRNGQGVLLAGTTDSTVENNTLSTEYYGIYMVDSSNVTITNCTIANCNFAMEIWYSSGNKIIGNRVVSNAYGIELAWSNYNNVSGNTIEQTSEYNGWGVCLAVSATGNQIYENDFVHNSQGMNIQLFYPGENKIYHNSFIQNSIHVYNYEPAISVWDDGYPSGGNYWSDYAGIDANHDGIGDTPYVIDASNVDNYPLMRSFANACHDVTVTSALPSKTIVRQGNVVQVNVTVENHGDFAEVFNLTLYANATQIASQEVALTRGGSASIAIEWGTSSFANGKYSLSAVADTLQGETNITDNVFTDGVVLITAKWDINADGKIDITDVAMVSAAFGSYAGHPRWRPAADINNDLKIDVIDIAMVARHFGESYL